MVRNDSRAATGGVRFKTGVVSAVDPKSGTVQVSFDDVGIVSDWLTVCYPKSAEDKAYWMLDVGEQVRCIMDEHLEDGAVLGSVYSSADAVPWASADKCGWVFKDGGSFTYDRAAGTMAITTIKDLDATVGGSLTANVTGNVTVVAAGITLQAPETVVQGNLRVKGATMLEGGVGGAAGASTVIPGSVKAADDVVAGIISLQGHEHTDSKGGTTSVPIGS